MVMVRQLFWVLAAFGSLIGGVEFFIVALGTKGAPQQAAGAAIAICWAVLPYVFARAIDEVARLAPPT